MTLHYIATSRGRLRAIMLAVLLATVAISCKVIFIGAYDEVTDQSFQKVQTEITEILLRVDKNITNSGELDYARFIDDYSRIEAGIGTLKVRCNAMPKYKQVATHANILGQSVEKLEAFHKAGLSQKDTTSLRIIRNSFNAEFTLITTLQNALKKEKNQ